MHLIEVRDQTRLTGICDYCYGLGQPATGKPTKRISIPGQPQFELCEPHIKLLKEDK